MGQAAAASLDELTAETAWLRGLARSLIRDLAEADDLVHDAYEIAATKAPSDGRPRRPWLGRVMVNLANMRRRSARRRLAREHAVGDLAAPPATPAELVQRVETNRMLAGLVLALAPPLRDVVLLHFVEGLSSREIGARLGLAAGTVRWRLKQALDELRARLDAQSPRRAWVAAVGALAGPPEAAAGGALLLALLALLVALAVVALRVAVVSEPVSIAELATERGKHASRTGLPALPPDDGALGGAISWSPPPVKLEGQLVDGARAPVAGAEVGVVAECWVRDDDPPRMTQTDAAGRFSIEVPPRCGYYVHATKGDLAARTSIARSIIPEPLAPVRLVASVQPPIAVHVVDAATGAGIPDARIVLDDGREVAVDGNGAAQFVARGVRLTTVRAPRYVSEAFQSHSTRGTPRDEYAELRKDHRRVALVRGDFELVVNVVDQRGRPLPGATVFALHHDDHRSARIRVEDTADERGGARLWVPVGLEYEVAAYVRASLADARISIEATGRTTTVTLAIADREPVLRGVVLDERGAPAGGATVTLPMSIYRPVTTDAEGRFHFNRISCGHRRMGRDAVVAYRGELASSPVSFDSRSCSVPELVLRLGRRGVTGIVVDTAGDPVAGAYVEHRAPAWFHVERVRTDAHGRFAMDIASGEHQLWVWNTPGEDAEDEAEVTVHGGDRDVRIVLPPP